MSCRRRRAVGSAQEREAVTALRADDDDDDDGGELLVQLTQVQLLVHLAVDTAPPRSSPAPTGSQHPCQLAPLAIDSSASSSSRTSTRRIDKAAQAVLGTRSPPIIRPSQPRLAQTPLQPSSRSSVASLARCGHRHSLPPELRRPGAGDARRTRRVAPCRRPELAVAAMPGCRDAAPLQYPARSLPPALAGLARSRYRFDEPGSLHPEQLELCRMSVRALRPALRRSLLGSSASRTGLRRCGRLCCGTNSS